MLGEYNREYLDAIGLIIFYESLPESSYNPIKLIMFCYLSLLKCGTGYREATHHLPLLLNSLFHDTTLNLARVHFESQHQKS